MALAKIRYISVALAIAVASVLLPAEPVVAQGQAGEQPTFDIWEFQVSGNTLLDNREIERTVYPFLGPGRTVGDVEGARRSLEELFRDSGFGTVVVNIPEQDVVDGLVRLDIVEGTVDRVLVTGARYFSPKQIKKRTPSLAPGEVPYLPQVQQELTALNAASRDRRITPILRPGRREGTVEVDLQVEDKTPLHGSLEVNDRFTRDTTKTRFNANISYDNLWQRQHSVSLGYQTAPEDRDDVEVWFGTYTARMTEKWLFSGYYVDSNSDVATVGTLGVVGKGRIGGLRFIRPLPQWGDGFQTVTFGVDLKDFDENIALEGNQPSIETPIKYGVLSALWGLNFVGEERNTGIGLLATVAPRFMGNDPLEFEAKRTGSKSSFAYLGFSFSHDRELWYDTSVRGAISGQISDSPMISNEQFSFGGATSVRGYLEAQQFVDDGLSGQFELLSPDWGNMLWSSSSIRLLAFIDAGYGTLQDPLPEQEDEFFLWSAGAGLRLALWRRFSAVLDWAYPFRDAVDDSVLKGDDRWHFNVRFDF